MKKIYADVPEELVDAILVRCPICDIVYRVMKFNIKKVQEQFFMETLCPTHKGLVYTPVNSEIQEKFAKLGIRFDGGQLLRDKDN